ncbi:MAG: NTP transferase domain-containing protein, partial [Victivallaceae bacterium]|nr:NTP transferase domain-containing protein [Victivallaceae bacterium]
MNKDLTLLVLAAGMGSRYGGLKQLDQLGPGGETIMDYSVFDALRAGFKRIVFVIRRDFEEDFKRVIGARYANHVALEYAFQSLDQLPGGFKVPEGRTKPWGTGHAVYCARELLDGPFAAINADDFYGEDSYRQLAGYLSNPPAQKEIRACIAAFALGNTLSENGTVSRGICQESDGCLTQVVEHTKIFRRDGRIFSALEDGTEVEFKGSEPVSMTSRGFMPEFLDELEELFLGFLAKRGTEMKSEFYLPFAVDSLIQAGKARVQMRHSADSWFGVTYREDRPVVQRELGKL